MTQATVTVAGAETSFASRPEGKPVYRPELDALRFFAFLTVFLHHILGASSAALLARWPFLMHAFTYFEQTLGLGLCLFFFLSSFLITSLLRMEKKRTGTVDLKKFYLRRMLRIWPLYFTFILVVTAIGTLWHQVYVEPMRLLALFLLAGNWYAIAAGSGAAVLTHLWSISVEEQFYLVWPSLGRVCTARSLGLACILIAACSLITTWILFERGTSELNIWFNTIVQSLFFATGALMALTIGLRAQKPSLSTSALFVLAGCFTCGLAEMIGGLTDHRAYTHGAWAGVMGYTLAAAGCASLLWGFLHIPRNLLWPPLVYLGRISYGLYVFHELFLVCTRELWFQHLHLPAVADLTALALTVVAAALSYQFLEKPFLKLKSRFELVKTRIA